MPFEIGWSEVALRLALTLLAGALLGLDRTERGMAAGLRTTLLVSLAASASMIQVNLLLGVSGKTPESFAVLDLMRLPLGILTGMGFIGAGAILRRGDVVTGVTTAATLWLATVLGLCFGGGQHGLGLAALAAGVVTLWGLKALEGRIRQERSAALTVSVRDGGPSEQDIRAALAPGTFRLSGWDVTYSGEGEDRRRRVCCEVHWRGLPGEQGPPEVVRQLAERPGVACVRWRAHE
jgi:putative Mg2+ transporter-C (MgtC) family protein